MYTGDWKRMGGGVSPRCGAPFRTKALLLFSCLRVTKYSTADVTVQKRYNLHHWVLLFCTLSPNTPPKTHIRTVTWSKFRERVCCWRGAKCDECWREFNLSYNLTPKTLCHPSGELAKRREKNGCKIIFYCAS